MALSGSLPRFERGPLGLFVAVAVVSALLADQPIAQALRLQPDAVLTRPWSVFTAAFCAPDGQLGVLIGTAVAQWMFGSTVARSRGDRAHVLLSVGIAALAYLLTAGVAAFVPGGAQVVLAGPAPIDMVATVGFGVALGRVEVALFGVVAVPARVLAAVFVGLSVLGPLARGAGLLQVLPAALAAALTLGWFRLEPWRARKRAGRRARAQAKARHLKLVN